MDSEHGSEHSSRYAHVEEKLPRLIQQYLDENSAVFEKGELSQREKTLIALAVAKAVQCPFSLDLFTQECQKNGRNIQEIIEAIHVATTVLGGASRVRRLQIRHRDNEVCVF